MSEQPVILRSLFKLCAALTLMSALLVPAFGGPHLIAGALGILSIYMILLAWDKIRKNIVLYLVCLAIVSCSMVLSYGLSNPMLVTVLMFFGGMFYLHFSLVKD